MCRYPELLGREATLHLLPSCVLCLAPPPAPPPAPPQLNPTPDTLGESRGLASGCGTVEGEWHLDNKLKLELKIEYVKYVKNFARFRWQYLGTTLRP